MAQRRPQQEESVWAMPGLDSFPALGTGSRGRKLYFSVAPEFYTALAERGYEVVMLSTLSRDGLLAEQEYLRAKLQGIEEGTVQADGEQLAALKHLVELSFGQKANKLVLTPGKKTEGVIEVLDWQSSRHTLKGNTTLAQARENPLSIGEQESGKN